VGNFRIPYPKNEPIHSYAPGSPERKKLEDAIEKLKSQKADIPMVINGEEIRVGIPIKITAPHDHSLVLGQNYQGGAEQVAAAVKAAMDAKQMWSAMPAWERASVFLKAADLLAGPYRYIMNAATMLTHSKNAFQAEIDCVCELVDFFRFNAYYMQMIYDQQPDSSPTMWNRLDYRPLEGFVFAVTPFNFVSIAGNLPSAPAIMGNTTVWKPASSVVYTAYIIMQIFKEAGLPNGVINMVTARGADIGKLVLENPDLGGIHFTGSTGVFQSMWKTVGANIANYKSYPRIVGETGGKDFVFVHNSADISQTVTALVRGAFEYQGQKCSAASRAYIPKSIWPALKDSLLSQVGSLKMGDPTDFKNFFNAIIDKSAYDSIVEYVDYANGSSDCEVLCGGKYDDSKGHFIEPTVVLAKDPHFKLMEEEIFGPVLTLYVYDDAKFTETLHICDETSPYALTGAIFSRERAPIEEAIKILRNAAGNFYINDKPTGAVVGQQPFGGARASGTNDKAGSFLNMIRWASPMTIKETFVPPTDYRYPFMG